MVRGRRLFQRRQFSLVVHVASRPVVKFKLTACRRLCRRPSSVVSQEQGMTARGQGAPAPQVHVICLVCQPLSEETDQVQSVKRRFHSRPPNRTNNLTSQQLVRQVVQLSQHTERSQALMESNRALQLDLLKFISATPTTHHRTLLEFLCASPGFLRPKP